MIPIVTSLDDPPSPPLHATRPAPPSSPPSLSCRAAEVWVSHCRFLRRLQLSRGAKDHLVSPAGSSDSDPECGPPEGSSRAPPSGRSSSSSKGTRSPCAQARYHPVNGGCMVRSSSSWTAPRTQNRRSNSDKAGHSKLTFPSDTIPLSDLQQWQRPSPALAWQCHYFSYSEITENHVYTLPIACRRSFKVLFYVNCWNNKTVARDTERVVLRTSGLL